MVCDYLDVIYIELGCQHTNLSNLLFIRRIIEENDKTLSLL